ncbi:MAG: hypothetical protein CXX81_15850, partial [Methanobacteriota archaeon]
YIQNGVGLLLNYGIEKSVTKRLYYIFFGLFLTFNKASVPHSKSKHQRIRTHIVICATKRAKECHTTVWGMNNGDKQK